MKASYLYRALIAVVAAFLMCATGKAQAQDLVIRMGAAPASGDDNASGLTADAAITRALDVGVPIYAVAEGEARRSSQLRKQLRMLSDRTGGISYEANSAADIQRVFRDIQGELKHMYLLTYRPPAADQAKWRTIRVEIGGGNSVHVRGKQGYFPE